MIAIKITDIKGFMSRLLAGDTFDQFYTSEVSISSFCHFSIDGNLFKEFYDTDTAEVLDADKIDYASWRDIRPFCFSIMKGKLLPLRFKIVLTLKPEQLPPEIGQAAAAFDAEKISALFFNIQFREKELFCTTGVAAQAFSLSRQSEYEWDRMVETYLKNCGVSFE